MELREVHPLGVQGWVIPVFFKLLQLGFDVVSLLIGENVFFLEHRLVRCVLVPEGSRQQNLRIAFLRLDHDFDCVVLIFEQAPFPVV